MTSVEEQQIFASLSQSSTDIKSHLTLIGELIARRVENEVQSRPPVLQNPPKP